MVQFEKISTTTGAFFRFGLALVAQIIRRMSPPFVIIRGRPIRTIPAPVPSIAAFPSSICHDSPLYVGEVCKICYKGNPVGFNVPDDIWRKAVSNRLQNRVVCLWCFINLADNKMLPWDDHIQFFPVSKHSWACQE